MKQKKLLALIGSVCLILVLAALPFMMACPAPAPPEEVTPTPPEEEEPTPTPAPTPGLPKITWRVTTHCGGTLSMFEGEVVTSKGCAKLLCDNVTKRTNGDFTLQFFDAGALVKSKEAVPALSSGTIDGIFNAIGSVYAGVIPEGTYATNFMFGPNTLEDCWKMINETDYMDIMRHAYAKHNVYFLGRVATGDDGIYSQFPIRSAADLKGKKIKCGGVTSDILELFGAVPVNIPMPELYTALQRGTIDGSTAAYYCGITYKHFEVAKYCQSPVLFSTSTENLVSLDAWDSLPQEYKDILQEESDKIVEKSYKEWFRILNEKVREISERDFGVTWTTIPADEWARMRELSVPVWDEYAKKSDDCAKLNEIYKKIVGMK